MSAAEIVNKIWNYAHVLRDDGVGYGDYVEAAPGVLPRLWHPASLYLLHPSSRPAALVHPCTSQLPMNEVPHECV